MAMAALTAYWDRLLAEQPGMGYVRIARTLDKEALKKD